VDFLESKTYSEINLDETPIVLLGCGHFFTSESVDGVVGLDDVYTRDKTGKFDGLRDVSASLSGSMPSCPDCRVPIRQFVTKRYNRVINRAVMDETAKRFFTKGHVDLESLQSRLTEIENELPSKKESRETLAIGPKPTPQPKSIYDHCFRLSKEAADLGQKMGTEHQPAKRLMDAIALYQKPPTDKALSISSQMKKLKIVTPELDNQISLGARLIHIKARGIILRHQFGQLSKVLASNQAQARARIMHNLPRLSAESSHLICPDTVPFLKDCQDLIIQARSMSLSRIAITATLAFAMVVQLYGWSHRSSPESATSNSDLKNLKDTGLETLADRINTTRDFLADALVRCQELGNCEDLQERVTEMTHLFEGPRYETVTPEELASIKTAMIGGPRGMATNSGHWYNCINGHPVSVPI
jgi:hypothetical protein